MRRRAAAGGCVRYSKASSGRREKPVNVEEPAVQPHFVCAKANDPFEPNRAAGVVLSPALSIPVKEAPARRRDPEVFGPGTANVEQLLGEAIFARNQLVRCAPPVFFPREDPAIGSRRPAKGSMAP